MRKPNLFIAGYAKSGTTAIYYYLLKHKEAFCCEYLKEPRYFSYEYFKRTNAYQYILKNAVKTENEYLSLYRKHKNEKYIVDGSVYYSAFRGIPEKIKQFNPDAKILLCIRNPVERLYSHYMMHIRNGFQKCSFDEFIKQPYSSEGINLIEIGKYFTSIKEFYDVFDKDNVLVTVYDDMLYNAPDFYRKICDFLSIEYQPPDNKVINPSGKFKNRVLVLFVKGLKAIIPFSVSRRLPFNFKSLFNSFLYNSKTLMKEEIPSHIKKELIDYYSEDIKKVEELIDRDLKNWMRG